MHGVEDDRIRRLTAENDALKRENGSLRVSVIRGLEEAATVSRHFLGHHVLIQSIKNYNLIGLNFPTCACKYCVGLGGIDFLEVDIPDTPCLVYMDVVNWMDRNGMTYSFLDGPEVVTTAFDGNRMFFKGDPLSVRFDHLVFYERGDVYKFKYGSKLHGCDSLLEPDITKLTRLIDFLGSNERV